LLPKFPIFLEELRKTGELDAYMKFVGPEYGKHGVSKFPYEPVTTDINEAAIEPAIRDRRQQIKQNEKDAAAYIEVAKEILDEVRGGTWDRGKVTLRVGPFQQKGRGAVEFLEDGTALIRALENPDASTGAHELAHIARRWLMDPSIPEENRVGITDDHIRTAEEWAGARDGNWTVDA
jgi:hypothetical protein